MVNLGGSWRSAGVNTRSLKMPGHSLVSARRRCVHQYLISFLSIYLHVCLYISRHDDASHLHSSLPAFAEGLSTAPLVSISFAKLESGDQETSEAFFKACKELGFFYLDMFGSELGEQIVTESEKLNELQKVFFKLPFEIKNKYGRPHLDSFYAYRY